MIRNGDAFNAYQRARFMRPDAYRWIRPDIDRFCNAGTVSDFLLEVGSVQRNIAQANRAYRRSAWRWSLDR